MSILNRIERGRVSRPPRLLLYGVEGIGKSSFASCAPRPIFIQTEDGLDEIDCDKFPLATSLADVTTTLGALQSEEHDFQTVVRRQSRLARAADLGSCLPGLRRQEHREGRWRLRPRLHACPDVLA